jgi:hypothetical protein
MPKPNITGKIALIGLIFLASHFLTGCAHRAQSGSLKASALTPALIEILLSRMPAPATTNLDGSPLPPLETTARVRAVMGNVMYSKDAAHWESLPRNTKLPAGYFIRSGDNGVCDLYNKDISTVIRINPDTLVHLRTLRVTENETNGPITLELDLLAGTLLGNVKHLHPASRYEVWTASGKTIRLFDAEWKISATGK